MVELRSSFSTLGRIQNYVLILPSLNENVYTVFTGILVVALGEGYPECLFIIQYLKFINH